MAAADPKGEGPITGQELKDLFSTGYYAFCTYFNDLPPYWQADIVQIGWKFVDDDGKDDDKGANVRIQSGQNQTLTSTYKGCCGMYFVVMKARAADGNEWNLVNSATVESGYCGGNLKWHLVQNKPRQSFRDIYGWLSQPYSEARTPCHAYAIMRADRESLSAMAGPHVSGARMAQY